MSTVVNINDRAERERKLKERFAKSWEKTETRKAKSDAWNNAIELVSKYSVRMPLSEFKPTKTYQARYDADKEYDVSRDVCYEYLYEKFKAQVIKFIQALEDWEGAGEQSFTELEMMEYEEKYLRAKYDLEKLLEVKI